MSKIFNVEKITYNENTGEVIEHTETKYKEVSVEPNYVKVYVDTMMLLMGKKKVSKDADVLLILAQNMTYMNTRHPNVVSVNKLLKQHIMETTGISEGALNNMLTSFVKRDILKRLDRGVYQLNPHMFAKGNWRDIRRVQMEWTEEEYKTIIETGD